MSATYAPCPHCHTVNRVSVEKAAHQQPVCSRCKTRLPIQRGVSEVDGQGMKALKEHSPLPIVADFWADWCGPCKAFAPVFVRASEDFAGRYVFVKVNTSHEPALAAEYHVRGIPTTVVLQGGREQSRQSGTMSGPQFSAWLNELLKRAS